MAVRSCSAASAVFPIVSASRGLLSGVTWRGSSTGGTRGLTVAQETDRFKDMFELGMACLEDVC